MASLRFSIVGPAILLTLGTAAAQPAPAPAPPAAAPPPPAEVPPPAPASPPTTPAFPPPTDPATPPAPAPVTTAAPPASDPPPTLPGTHTPLDPPEPEKPPALGIGSGGGTFQPGALLQFWLYAADEHRDQTLTFRIRRAELSIKGEVVPEVVGYRLMIDPARALEQEDSEIPVDGGGGGSVTVLQPPSSGPVTIFQDFFITFMSDYADVSIGQFKIPLSLEGYGSSSKILLPERALAARAYGDRRDIGLRVEKKLGDYFGYSLGLFNGRGQNRLDDDSAKDGALRLEGYPLKGLTLAAAGYTTIGKRTVSGRDRLEVDLRYDAHDVFAIAEYLHGWDSAGGGGAVEGHGAYVGVGYTLFDRLQPIARAGFLDRNLDDDLYGVRHYEVGAAWLIQKHEAKLWLALGHFVPDEAPTRTEGILAAQAAF